MAEQSGWNRAKPVAEQKPKKSSMMSHGLVAGLVVVIGAVGVIFFLLSGGEKEGVKEDARKSRRIAEVTPAPAPKAREAKPEKPKDDPRRPKTVPLEKWNALTSQQQAMMHKLGRKKIHEVVTNTSNSAGPKTYENATEQVMLMVFGTELGEMPLPLPEIPERDMKRMTDILMSNNPITDKDSEEVKIDKEILAAAKAELRKFIKEGGEVKDFFAYYHHETEKAYQERKMANKMVFDAAKSGDEDLARKLHAELNKRFEEKGIKPLVFPENILKKGLSK